MTTTAREVTPPRSAVLDTQNHILQDVGDAYVNNYNPYLLAVFRTSMDIQYNDGPQAVRYLAKYLAKDDYEAKILLKNIQAQNQGYYKRTTYSGWKNGSNVFVSQL
ncbi:hypothetical protein G6F63_012548 [Rhizopus arrhizus]|nr:hypothetical protein G6F41_013294 [Rhizopus arrhizus]KAG1324535.1 hypothetical protein G6F63_012548 [Rhizopus arrhizus]